jgi:hypothetical protein
LADITITASLSMARKSMFFSYGVLLLHKGCGVLYFNRFLFVRHASRRDGLAASITRHG